MDRYEFYDKINSYKKNDELKHYGTIGQKWGVRHWQNADGTFNAAGKERYFGSKGNGENKYQNEDGTLTRKGQRLLKKYRNGNEKAANIINDKINMDLYDKTVADPINVKKNSTNSYDINSGADSSFNEHQLSKYMSKKDVARAMKHRDLVEEITKTMYSDATVENILKFKEQMDSIEDKKEKNAVRSAVASIISISQHSKDGEGYNFRFEGKFGSQPGADKAKEEADSELFSKKNENGRSETADKMENAAKQIRDEGDEETAQKIEETSKEMREATSVTQDRKNMTKEEKKELRKAANNCWKVANKNAWVSWLLFGLPGYAINSIINWRLVKETARQEGLSGDSKEWSASDWNKITNSIMDKYPRKYKREIKKRDAANV